MGNLTFKAVWKKIKYISVHSKFYVSKVNVADNIRYVCLVSYFILFSVLKFITLSILPLLMIYVYSWWKATFRTKSIIFSFQRKRKIFQVKNTWAKTLYFGLMYCYRWNLWPNTQTLKLYFIPLLNVIVQKNITTVILSRSFLYFASVICI